MGDTCTKGGDKKLSHLQVLSMDFLFDDRQSGGHTLHGLVDGILNELGQCWIVWGRRCFLGRLLAAFSLHFCPLVVTPVLIQLTWLVRLARTTDEAQG